MSSAPEKKNEAEPYLEGPPCESVLQGSAPDVEGNDSRVQDDQAVEGRGEAEETLSQSPGEEESGTEESYLSEDDPYMEGFYPEEGFPYEASCMSQFELAVIQLRDLSLYATFVRNAG